MRPDQLENILAQIDTLLPAPEKEPQRQYYFIKKLRGLYTEMYVKKHRELTYHVETFGCQMNAKDSEKLAGILSAIGFKETESEKAA